MYRGTYYSSPFSSASRHRRKFHRLGIIVAAIVVATGTAVIMAGVMRLELWDALQIVVGSSLIALAVLCLAVYLLFRAIGSVLAGFTTRCDVHWTMGCSMDREKTTSDCRVTLRIPLNS
jgi:hypothetical protein